MAKIFDIMVSNDIAASKQDTELSERKGTQQDFFFFFL